MNNPKDTVVNGKSKYARVLIRKIRNYMVGGKSQVLQIL